VSADTLGPRSNFVRGTLPTRSVERKAAEGNGSLGSTDGGEEDIHGDWLHRKHKLGICQEIPDPNLRHTQHAGRSWNHKQSLPNHRNLRRRGAKPHSHALGALSQEGGLSPNTLHQGRVHNLRETLDCSNAGASTRKVKTVEVEGWIRAAGVCGGPKATNQCCDVGSLFRKPCGGSFVATNPLSSGIPVGSGAARPREAVRIRANVRDHPLVLSRRRSSSDGRIEFRASVVCSVSRRSLGTQGALGSVRGCRRISDRTWSIRSTFVLLASRWKPEEHKTEGLQTVAEHPKLKNIPGRSARSPSLTHTPADLVFPSGDYKPKAVRSRFRC